MIEMILTWVISTIGALLMLVCLAGIYVKFHDGRE